MRRLSVLDLSPIIEGGDAALAFRNTVDLVQQAARFEASPARNDRDAIQVLYVNHV